MSDFSWMQVVDAGARALSTGSDTMTNAAIVERLRAIYGDIKAQAGEDGGWLKHYEAIGIAADRIVILADAVRGDFECIGRLADERNAAREERDELRLIASKLTAERDEARRLLKAVVDITLDNMVPDANPKHPCDFVHRPDIAMCKVCENWTDALVMCYPDDFQDEEDGK